MKGQILKQSNCKLNEHSEITTLQDYSNPYYQFKILQLQQQNQNLGEQSQSLIHFPSQTLVNQDIRLDANIRNGVNSEMCNLQNKNSKSCANNSFSYKQQESQCFEQNSKLTNENQDTCCYLSKTDQQVHQENKIQFLQSSFCERQSLFSVNQASSMLAKQEKNKVVNFLIPLDSKEVNKSEQKQKGGFKKRNNLLTRDNNAQKQVWRKKWLQILALVSKMKKAAYQSSLFFRPQCLREIQIRLINDLSSNQVHQNELTQLDKYNLGRLFTYSNFQGIMSFKNYRKTLKFIIKYFGFLITAYDFLINQIQMIGICIFKFFPLFHNLSTSYILWEALNSTASLILFVYLPYEYCFSLTRGQFFQYYINYFCTIIFSIDIFVKFNTVSTEQGNPVEQHMQIFTSYIRSTFFIDLISFLSLNHNIFGFDGLYFVFFLRIFQPFRILELFREQFLLKTKIFGVISLIYLLAQVIYFAHLFTCLWNYVGLLELKSNTGWIVAYNYQTESVASRYIYTFYYAVVTMTTIGYGDFTAQTQLEKLLMIFIAFFSCGIFGYTINSIGNILYDFKQKRDLYLQELAKINKYFKQNNVELGLQCRAKKYIQYIYSDQYSDQSCSIKSLSSLSVYLQKEIQQDVYIKMLKKVPIFREIASEQIFNELALLMKEKIVCHDQIITNQEEDEEEENEQFIYFVNDGTILEYCQHDSQTQIKDIQKFKYGQYFGLVQFMSGDTNRKLKYKSIGVSSILQLSCSNLRDVLKKYDLEYQKFCHILDQVRFQNKFQKINSYCFSCQQKNHRIEECPYLFYEGKKSIILRQYLKECDYKIKNFERKKQEKSLNSLISQAYVSQLADKYFLQNMPCFSMWYQSQESETSQESSSNSDQETENESKESSLIEKNQLEAERKVYSEQKLGECKKIGSLIDDQQLQLRDRKLSLQVQKNVNNLHDYGEVNSSNLSNMKKVNSGINPSKIFQEDEGSIILEENLNIQGNKNKRNRSQKNVNTKDSNLNIFNLQEYDQYGNALSETKIQTNQKIEIQQAQSLQIQKQTNKYQEIFKNIEFMLANHPPLYCLNQNCQICFQTENNIQNIIKELFISEKYTPNQKTYQNFENQKMKSILQLTKQRTAFIQSQNNMKTQNFSYKNLNNHQFLGKRGSKYIQGLFQQPFIYDFDKMRNFQFYFVDGNYQAVLDRYQITQKHKIFYQEQKLFISQHSTKFNQRIN
ncbi:cation channel family protein (macronuclear) [Tetrahymena thermophila SB210]|uniref:Cation channel family protein n=1 Tax=Tetrahymena thermophila (strain SB210) TaxID=312017 RepID=W7XL09_TETTS|nr:cation channel family protein [Tetrahymena thermophila SB210]EWS75469.1 cation channel family protein [Tetrahymena thermophila SB210]|eukprot:XP_012651938.1 cation channel family protein [Tetrahymena thermophila SB210]